MQFYFLVVSPRNGRVGGRAGAGGDEEAEEAGGAGGAGEENTSLSCLFPSSPIPWK
ncbi:hypothetical protein [Nostoc sp.]|uniref:hypothetical protein n=1 Tax=Nostoc sp. TaxID=1180 RepID=UPI002FFCA005